MKTNNKKRILSLLMTLLIVLTFAAPAIAAPVIVEKVELGDTTSFAILAGTTITNIGATTINGDAGGNIGLYAGSAVTGFSSDLAIANHVTMSGSQYLSDAAGVALAAKNALLTAYDDAAGRTGGLPISGIGGGQTLDPGLYTSATSIDISGDLTLDAHGNPDAVFIFQAGTSLITAPGSRIILANGARYCRIFWQVGSSATLGINSVFVGHIFALTSIWAGTGATIQGQLLARNGEVTLAGNTITNGICAASATLRVIKQVINDDGGTKVAADFNLHVKTPGALGIDVLNSPAQGNALGTIYTLPAGTYVVSETTTAGYTAVYSGDSDSSGNITLAAGGNYTVTITNNDVHVPVLYPPLINVIKTPAPLALTSGAGQVTYSYTVTNPSVVALSNVSVTDDKLSTVNYVTGDANGDNLLQPSETWIYTATTILTETTTNTATAIGRANGMTATDIATAKVIVTATPPVTTPPVTTPPVTTPPVTTPPVTTPPVTTPPVTTPSVTTPPVTTPPVTTLPVTETTTGGELPNTSNAAPGFSLLLAGVVLFLLGAFGWRTKKRND